MTENGSDLSSSRGRRPMEGTGEEAGQHKLPPTVAFDFEELANGQSCIQIRLAGETYTLRKTQSGKLILNK